jgi:hypothetical protein
MTIYRTKKRVNPPSMIIMLALPIDGAIFSIEREGIER